MKKNSHRFMSLGIGSFLLTIFNLFQNIGIIYFFMLPIYFEAGIINDILDYKLFNKHKRYFWTHSPFSPLLIGLAIILGLFGILINLPFSMFLTISMWFIFEIHILLDALNPTGIPLLFNNKKISNIPYDDFKWNAIFILIGIILTGISLFNNLLIYYG